LARHHGLALVCGWRIRRWRRHWYHCHRGWPGVGLTARGRSQSRAPMHRPCPLWRWGRRTRRYRRRRRRRRHVLMEGVAQGNANIVDVFCAGLQEQGELFSLPLPVTSHHANGNGEDLHRRHCEADTNGRSRCAARACVRQRCCCGAGVVAFETVDEVCHSSARSWQWRC
jgi:hypothetical protein